MFTEVPRNAGLLFNGDPVQCAIAIPSRSGHNQGLLAFRSTISDHITKETLFPFCPFVSQYSEIYSVTATV